MTQQKNDLPLDEKAQIVALVEAILGTQPDEIELDMTLAGGIRLNINGSDLNAAEEEAEEADSDEDEDADEDDDNISELSIRIAFPAPFTEFRAQVVFDFESLDEMQEWAKN